jgi:hypothetical protein
MKTLNWKKKDGQMEVDVPIQIWAGDEGRGNYWIIIAKRPHYCDRGDWIIYVEGRHDLDAADGFPRYFFGTEGEVKKQMEIWLCRRKAFQDYERR